MTTWRGCWRSATWERLGHGNTQGRIYAYIIQNLPKFWAAPEIRVQVKPDRFRIPDVTIVKGKMPSGKYIQEAPIVVVEVISPEDRLHRMLERIDDYLAFGVSAVWVLDPESKRGFVYTSEGSREAKDGVLRTPADAELTVPLASVFVTE